MCGIVGHIGAQNSVDVILEGLSRLEYRGYDSAGICTRNDERKLLIQKKAGKLENLRSLIDESPYKAHIGIGHTRWATHGAVTEINAHPHGNGICAIVHNGIIENASELRETLREEGFEFKSETDSEVFYVLLVKHINNNHDLKSAIVESFKFITGNSAFVILGKEDDFLYAIKRGAPLVCGDRRESHDQYVSSDPYALIGHADRLYFPEDEVLCVLNSEVNKKLEFFELDLSPSERVDIRPQIMNLEAIDKGEYEHYMLKEIFEQPVLIRELINYYTKAQGKDRLELAKKLPFNRVHITACGTAWHAGLLIKDYLERYNRIPTQIELASEFRYRNPLLVKDELGLFISQSGETADTLAAQQLCADNELKTLSIVNVEGSTLYRDCDANLLIKAGAEIGVASTKAFTLQVLTGYFLSQYLNDNLEDTKVLREVAVLADRVEDFLKEKEDLVKDIASHIYRKKGFIFTGRGQYFPIALEGALKLKEIAYVHAEGYAAGELKHGPIALIDEDMVNVAYLGPELFDKSLSNVEEVKARNGIILGVGPENSKALKQISDYYIDLNFDGLDHLAPILLNIVGQLLSYHIAKLKGTDIDKPRNLAKSVTVE